MVGQVAPWNYPMMMGVWKCAPALAAGNTVVLKPADTTPATTELIAKIASEIFPKGVLNVVLGDRETGAALIAHPTPSMVSITGSVRAGISVATSAAADVKRVHLELGGKAPVVVFEDADVRAAAEIIAVAGFFNAGQDCTSANRVLVAEGAYDEFVEAIAEQAGAVVTTQAVGAHHPDALLPPVNNVNQLAQVTDSSTALPDHAQIAAGGARAGDRGFHYAPTVVANLRQDDEIIQEGGLRPGHHRPEVHRRRGCAAQGQRSPVRPRLLGVDRDLSRAMRMTKALDFGCVWVNNHIPLVAEMPHGGFKHSGYGKDLSMYGLEDYTRIKHVMINYTV